MHASEAFPSQPRPTAGGSGARLAELLGNRDHGQARMCHKAGHEAAEDLLARGHGRSLGAVDLAQCHDGGFGRRPQRSGTPYALSPAVAVPR